MRQPNRKNKIYLFGLKASPIYLPVLCVYLLVFMMGCNKSQNSDTKAVKMNSNNMHISEKTLKNLMVIKDKRIYFMHHSVGNNILSGLKTLSSESGINLKIVRPNNQTVSPAKVFVDATGGTNQQPKTKVNSFVEQIKGLNSNVVPDIAFMKFCFVDFNPSSNVKELFTYYKSAIQTLKKNKPEITFVHLTVPLTTRPNSIKDKINRLFGRQVWGDTSNVKRAEFNKLLFEAFPQDPIFDIARVESTLPDGSRSSFVQDDKTYYSLATAYTDDGGHLNTIGQRRAAIEIAKFLAKIPNIKQLK